MADPFVPYYLRSANEGLTTLTSPDGKVAAYSNRTTLQVYAVVR